MAEVEGEAVVRPRGAVVDEHVAVVVEAVAGFWKAFRHVRSFVVAISAAGRGRHAVAVYVDHGADLDAFAGDAAHVGAAAGAIPVGRAFDLSRRERGSRRRDLGAGPTARVLRVGSEEQGHYQGGEEPEPPSSGLALAKHGPSIQCLLRACGPLPSSLPSWGDSPTLPE